MANKKTTAAEAAPKAKRTRKPAAPKIVLKDTVLWVISRRTKLFFWQPIQAFDTEAKGREYLAAYESDGNYGGRSYKLDRVDLITMSLDEVVEALETP